MKKISFVIPAYNVEEHISKCLNSILSQSLDESVYEVLVINDGSTDATGDIVNEYIKKFKNIKLINQENKGLAETRNVGVRRSIGRYIWFVDSDDYIVENCTIDLLKFSEDNDLDMLLVAPAARVTEDFQKDWEKNFPLEIVKGKDYLACGAIDVGVWAYVFKRSFVEENKLHFLSGYYFEDVEFTPRAIFYAKNIGLLNFSVYHYIQRDQSIMHTFSPSRLSHYINVAKAIEKFRKINRDDIVVQQFFSSNVAGMVLAGFKAIAAHNLSQRFLDGYVAECRSSGLLPLKQVKPGFLRLVAITCASKFPDFYVKVLKLKNIFSN